MGPRAARRSSSATRTTARARPTRRAPSTTSCGRTCRCCCRPCTPRTRCPRSSAASRTRTRSGARHPRCWSAASTSASRRSRSRTSCARPCSTASCRAAAWSGCATCRTSCRASATEAAGGTLTDDVDPAPEEKLSGDPQAQPRRVIEDEECLVDYVHWRDFGHTWRAPGGSARRVAHRLPDPRRVRQALRRGDRQQIPLSATEKGQGQGRRARCRPQEGGHLRDLGQGHAHRDLAVQGIPAGPAGPEGRPAAACPASSPARARCTRRSTTSR
jgi:hypothetical protein